MKTCKRKITYSVLCYVLNSNRNFQSRNSHAGYLSISAKRRHQIKTEFVLTHELYQYFKCKILFCNNSPATVLFKWIMLIRVFLDIGLL